MLVKILKNPITLFISIFIGILIGLYVSSLVPFLSILNQIYLSLLQVCVIPIVACAILINIGQLFKKQFRRILSKWTISIIIAMIFASLLGISLTLMTRDFIAPDNDTKVALSKMDTSEQENKSTTETFSELSFYEENKIEQVHKLTITEFITNSIPSNIFKALTENNIIQVLIFCCILGITFAFIDKQYSEPFLIIATGVYKALCKFIDYLMIFLPIAICSLLAEQFSNEGVISILGSLAKYIVINYVAVIILIIVSFILIQFKTKCSLSEHWHAVKQTLFVSIATSSCIASIPKLIEDIPEPLGLDKKAVKSVTPIGVILCQTGTIVAAAILAIYSTTIYDVAIDAKTLIIVLLASIIFSISITGVPGIVSATMLNIILQPIGVPSDLMTLIFISTVSFYQGVNVFASLYSNVAITSFVLPSKKRERSRLVALNE